MRNVCSRCLLAAAVGVFVCAAGDAPADGGRTLEKLQALLAERREMEARAEREQAAWAAEKDELALLLRERKARLAELEKKNDALQARVDALGVRVKAAQDEAAALARRAESARAWLADAIAKVKAALAANPLLGDAESSAGMERAGAADMPRAEAHEVFWRSLLRMAARSLEARVEAQTIQLSGLAREVCVVRLGSCCAFYVTNDRRDCGYAENRDGRVTWLPFSREYVPTLLEAARVIRGQCPAEEMWAPIPRSRIAAEGAK